MSNLDASIWLYLMIWGGKMEPSNPWGKYIPVKKEKYFICLKEGCNRLYDDDEALYCKDKQHPDKCERRQDSKEFREYDKMMRDAKNIIIDG